MKFNEKEMELIEKIREAEQYVVGEIEIDYDYDADIPGWYALDYRKDLEAAVSINNKAYDTPIITEEDAERDKVDVGKVCSYLDVWYVG